MNRILLCLALIAAIVSVQTLSLHAHLANGESDSAGSHLHIHSHAGDPAHHGEAEPGIEGDVIELLTSTAARDAGALHLDLAVTLFLTLLLFVVWHGHRQGPRVEPPVHRTKLSHRRPSPRAPPLFASPF